MTKSQKNIEKIYSSPLGTIKIQATHRGLTCIKFIHNFDKKSENNDTNSHILECEEQLKEYFARKRKIFDLTLIYSDDISEFQKSVWNKIDKIQYGETISYKKIASSLNNPNASRAIGMACNKNPFHIVTPCHRVVGSNNSLTGYYAGIETKQKLLALEAK